MLENQAMNDVPYLTRRRLLRGFAAAAPVAGTFLLPSASCEALAGTPPHGPRAPRAWYKAPAHHATHQRQPTVHTVRQRAPPEKPLIMLDPGHGGKDPGAIGLSGTYEKFVALATALDLRRQLEGNGGYRVAMTRSRDVFIPLEDRVAMARRHKAALFISLHADSVADHTTRGASVYTWALAASDAQADWLAHTENRAASPRFLPSHPARRTPAMRQILMRGVLGVTHARSIDLARDVVASLKPVVPILVDPERSARFVVLTATGIPSVLVEMGFLSNRQDEAALRQPQHRRLLAEAMHRAVDTYFAAPNAPAMPGQSALG
jgi:N-acetylmuramoyl-L-alanine amidase